MFAPYIVSTENRQLYAGGNYYMAVEYFKWACANNFDTVEFKELGEHGHYNLIRKFYGKS